LTSFESANEGVMPLWVVAKFLAQHKSTGVCD
jgi:hypothetical protein